VSRSSVSCSPRLTSLGQCCATFSTGRGSKFFLWVVICCPRATLYYVELGNAVFNVARVWQCCCSFNSVPIFSMTVCVSLLTYICTQSLLYSPSRVKFSPKFRLCFLFISVHQCHYFKARPPAVPVYHQSTILLTLCPSEMLHPSKVRPQGAHLNRMVNKMR